MGGTSADDLEKPAVSKDSLPTLVHYGEPGCDVGALLSQPRWFGVRFQMVLFTALGAATMVAHHLFYHFLDTTEVEQDNLFDPRIKLTKEALVVQAGNAIATVGALAFGSAIGIASVQVLWWSLGQNAHSVRQIQAIMECRARPYSPSAWQAWGASQKLSLLAVLGSLMALIHIFAPSSLRTILDLSDAEDCTVARVDLDAPVYDKLYDFDDGVQKSTSDAPSHLLKRLVTGNLINGDYLSPPNPLDKPVSYTVALNAPSMSCSDTTPDFDFTNMVQNSAASELVIWNATHDIHLGGSTVQVAVLGGPDADTGRAITCNVFNATYSLEVNHDEDTTFVNVGGIDRRQRLSASNISTSGYNALYYSALAIGQILDGFVKIDAGMVQVIPPNDVWNFIDNNFDILNSPLGTENPAPSNASMPWIWDPKLPDLLSDFSTNVAISLLTNPLNIPTINTKSQCRYPGLFYTYSPLHLFLTYGLGLLTTICCVLAGFYAISVNKREESMHFSRLLVAILNPGLRTGNLTSETRLQTFDCESGAYSQFGAELVGRESAP